MTNFLKNGTVLPFGLLSSNTGAYLAGFNRAYKNTALRVGVVIASYPVKNKNNLYKLTTEYDVVVMEQNESESITMVTYANCISSEGFGSLADFFEKTLRPIKKNKNKKNVIDLKNHDGSVVLIHCLDGMTAKGVIVGSLTHPDRKTNLKDDLPYLEGEYNGVNIKIFSDGSTSLEFKGATNNDGTALDSSQGATTIKIEKDGSFQVGHDGGSFRLARDGNATVSCKNVTVTASENAIVEGKNVKLGKDASESVIKGDSFKTYFSGHTHPTLVGPSGPPAQPFTQDLLSKKAKTE